MVPLFPPTTYVQTSRGPIKAIHIKVPVGIPTPDGGLEIPNRVFLGGIPSETTELELETFFCDYGLVKDVRIVTDRMTGESKGFGFVTFDENEDIGNLLKSQTIMMKGKKLRIRKAIRRNSSQFVDNNSSTSPSSTNSSNGSVTSSSNHLQTNGHHTTNSHQAMEPVVLLRSPPAVEPPTNHYTNCPQHTYQPMQSSYYPSTSFQSQQCSANQQFQQQNFPPMQFYHGGQMAPPVYQPTYFVPYNPAHSYGNYGYPTY